jgi:hypothetical protein
LKTGYLFINLSPQESITWIPRIPLYGKDDLIEKLVPKLSKQVCHAVKIDMISLELTSIMRYRDEKKEKEEEGRK